MSLTLVLNYVRSAINSPYEYETLSHAVVSEQLHSGAIVRILFYFFMIIIMLMVLTKRLKQAFTLLYYGHHVLNK